MITMSVSTNRNFYLAFNQIGKGKECPNELINVLIFKSAKERSDFMDKMNDERFYVITRKEAFEIKSLNEQGKKPCVYQSSLLGKIRVYLLDDVRRCWGNWYQYLTDFQAVIK